MKVIQTVKDLQHWRAHVGGTVGFVPTMGNLHQGHASLVKASVAGTDHTVVSIFVNPTQFNNANDFENYPKTLEADAMMLDALGVDVLFAPPAQEMYPKGFAHKVCRTSESRILCDAHRPGHFDGVLTVVEKLFALVRPQKAYFGEKDYQQYLYIREMAEDLFLGVEVVACPTKREAGGLAMSSRNNRLSPAAKEKAAQVHHWIHYDKLSLDDLSKRMSLNGMKLEYLEEHWGRRFVAFWIEDVRLIDNVVIGEHIGDVISIKEPV